MGEMIPKTYRIDVTGILSRRRGQYDLEDEFLWFSEFLREDTDWTEDGHHKVVTVSDNPRESRIQLDCPNIELINEKQHFVKYCGSERWVPQSVILRVDDDSRLTRRSLELLDNKKLLTGLVFLKKAGPGIGGGFDVTPLLSPSIESVEKAIGRQNSTSKRYRRKVFVLQKGVQHPLLTRLGQKIDLRLYILMVGSPWIPGIAFYACSVGDMRNTAAFPYNPESTDPRLQVTNIAQNRKLVEHTSDITRIFSQDSVNRELYDSIFSGFLYIVKRIAAIYTPYLTPKDTGFVTLIGADAVVDSETLMPMIVELNRLPTVYTPAEAREMNYSSALFMRDVFDLGVRGISNGIFSEGSEYFTRVS